MKLEEQLEEQPPEKKPRIDNGQEEQGNASNPNVSELPKSLEGNKESELQTKDLSSGGHSRPLPLELNCEIFECLKLPIQRKFICGLGRGIYGMSRQKVLKKEEEADRNRKRRVLFGKEQVWLLESTFRENKFINGAHRRELARRCGLTSDQVKIWFQNRRYKQKKKDKDAAFMALGTSRPNHSNMTARSVQD